MRRLGRGATAHWSAAFILPDPFALNIALTSVPALLLVEICVYAAATILFLAVERPFLQLRHRIAGRQPR